MESTWYTKKWASLGAYHQATLNEPPELDNERDSRMHESYQNNVNCTTSVENKNRKSSKIKLSKTEDDKNDARKLKEQIKKQNFNKAKSKNEMFIY